MIITSFCKNFLEKYSEEYLKKSKNPLKIDKRIIFGLLDGSKNISFKTAENLTKKFNKFLEIEENLEKFFIKEKLLSEEKERKIILDFPDNKEKKEENSFWLEIIHYILTGKFEGFGKVGFLIFLFIFSLMILIFLFIFYKFCMEKTLKVAIYIRVSTEEQAKDGYGLESQERILKAFITANEDKNWITNESLIYRDEGVSGATDVNSRPALSLLEKDILLGKVDVVLVWKIDRLFRHTQSLLSFVEFLQEKGIIFVSKSESIDLSSPSGKLVLTLL